MIVFFGVSQLCVREHHIVLSETWSPKSISHLCETWICKLDVNNIIQVSDHSFPCTHLCPQIKACISKSLKQKRLINNVMMVYVLK